MVDDKIVQTGCFSIWMKCETKNRKKRKKADSDVWKVVWHIKAAYIVKNFILHGRKQQWLCTTGSTSVQYQCSGAYNLIYKTQIPSSVKESIIIYYKLNPEIYTYLYTRPFIIQNLTFEHTQNYNVTSVGQMQCEIDCAIKLIEKKERDNNFSIMVTIITGAMW